VSPETVMKIAENIEALELRVNFTGGESVIHPALPFRTVSEEAFSEVRS
jgi:hypothetical protein